MDVESISATVLFRSFPRPILENNIDRGRPEVDEVDMGTSPRRVRAISCVWSEGTVLSRAGNMLVVKWDNGSISYLPEGDFVWI